jgi:hypothetical protein
MKKHAIQAKVRKQASPKLHLIKRKNDIDSLTQIEEGKERYDIINQAINAYFIEYTLPGKQLTKPGLNSSSVDSGRVYLRTGKFLLAIFQIESAKFIRLTPELIKKYSK